jgi:hypothetical protein
MVDEVVKNRNALKQIKLLQLKKQYKANHHK